MARLFVAADVPDAVKHDVERDVVEPMRDRIEGARWTRPEGRHLTIAFLGQMDEELVPMLGDAIAGAATGHAAFRIIFDELGGFPNLRRPRVLWLGVGHGRDVLVSLARDVQLALKPLGFEPEARAYHPHLTLARFPKPKILEVDRPEAGRHEAEVQAVTLFRSELHPKGARYTPMVVSPLGS